MFQASLVARLSGYFNLLDSIIIFKGTLKLTVNLITRFRPLQIKDTGQYVTITRVGNCIRCYALKNILLELLLLYLNSLFYLYTFENILKNI